MSLGIGLARCQRIASHDKALGKNSDPACADTRITTNFVAKDDETRSEHQIASMAKGRIRRT